MPCRHRCINKPSLYVTRSGTSSQCSSVWMSVIMPRSYFLVPLTTRAAALSTRCNCNCQRALFAVNLQPAYVMSQCLLGGWQKMQGQIDPCNGDGRKSTAVVLTEHWPASIYGREAKSLHNRLYVVLRDLKTNNCFKHSH